MLAENHVMQVLYKKNSIAHWSKVPKNVQSREDKVWQQYYHFYYLLTISKYEIFCEN